MPKSHISNGVLLVLVFKPSKLENFVCDSFVPRDLEWQLLYEFLELPSKIEMIKKLLLKMSLKCTEIFTKNYKIRNSNLDFGWFQFSPCAWVQLIKVVSRSAPTKSHLWLKGAIIIIIIMIIIMIMIIIIIIIMIIIIIIIIIEEEVDWGLVGE